MAYYNTRAEAIASFDQVRRVWLVDTVADAAAGKALDIQQAGAVAGALPAMLAAPGIEQTRVPELSTRGRVKLQTALGG